jgi:hypothetical protein
MRSLRLSLVAAFAALVPLAAQNTRDPAETIKPSTPPKAAYGKPAARGPLPDPTLLDGSSLPAEKRPEHGMLGEFEIPGDDNAKGGKVGGPGGGGGGPKDQKPDKPEPGIQIALPPIPGVGLPIPGGGGLGTAPGGGLGLPDPLKQPPPGGASGGAGSAGAIPPGADGGDSSAGGQQVAGLKTDPSAAGGTNQTTVQRPKPVGIGDPAMQIKGAANAPSAVGGAPAGATQQAESQTGGSGKGGSSNDNGNKGVEKGRVMPAGL